MLTVGDHCRLFQRNDRTEKFMGRWRTLFKRLFQVRLRSKPVLGEHTMDKTKWLAERYHEWVSSSVLFYR